MLPLVHGILGFSKSLRLEICIAVRSALRVHSLVHRVSFFGRFQLEFCVAVLSAQQMHALVHGVLAFSKPIQLEMCIIAPSVLRVHSVVHNVMVFRNPPPRNVHSRSVNAAGSFTRE